MSRFLSIDSLPKINTLPFSYIYIPFNKLLIYLVITVDTTNTPLTISLENATAEIKAGKEIRIRRIPAIVLEVRLSGGKV